MKTIAIGILLAMLGCNDAGCSTTASDVKTGVIDVVRCAAKYPADVVLETARFMEATRHNDGFLVAVMTWAEQAKDGQFAMCVLTTLRRDITQPSVSANTRVALAGDPEAEALSAAIEKFRTARFSNTVFEPVPR